MLAISKPILSLTNKQCLTPFICNYCPLIHSLRRRGYSTEGPTLTQIYERFKYVEDIMQKYRPDLATRTSTLDELVRDGRIPKQMGEYYKEYLKKKQETIKSANFWIRVFWFVGIPVIAGTGYYVYQEEMAHYKHLEEHPPEKIKYPYMKWRVKVENFNLEISLGRWRHLPLSQSKGQFVIKKKNLCFV